MKQRDRVALREAIIGYDPFVYIEEEDEETPEIVLPETKRKLNESSRPANLPFWMKPKQEGTYGFKAVTGPVDLEKEMHGNSAPSVVEKQVMEAQESESQPTEKQTYTPPSNPKVIRGKHEVL